MKRTLPFVCLLALCSLNLLAQTEKNPRIVHTTEGSAIHLPPQEAPAGLKKIYSNLGPKADLYNDGGGWIVAGPNNTHPTRMEFAGMPFTPKSNFLVSQVQVAVQYGGSGANQMNLSIYGDSEGVPGTLLAGPVTVPNLPTYPSCCALAIAEFAPVAVTAGTQYWVVADTPQSGTGSDFFGYWQTVSTRPILMAADGGGGWLADDSNDLIAGEVLGTALAQSDEGPVAVPAKESSATRVLPQEAPGLKKIYNNLGESIDTNSAWFVLGPNSGAITSSFVGMPFTPKSDSHVSQVQLPMAYWTGANQVNLNIYEDTGGVPGTLLAGPVTVTNLPTFPSWGYAVADFTPVAVAAGTRYWVVADTPLSGTGSDFSGTWFTVGKDILMALNSGPDYAWQDVDADFLAAAEVLGTIP